jgi:hypothetical protein
MCLDLSTNNTIVFRHVVFYETDFPFAVSHRLTNDLDIFLQDDSWSVTPMPTPLPPPLPGFSFCSDAGGLTTRYSEVDDAIAGPRSLTVPPPPPAPNDADGTTVSPGGQTTLGTEDGGLTTTPGGQTAGPHVVPSSPASSTSAAPHAGPTTSPAPRAAPVSMTPPTPLVAPTPQHYSCHPQTAWELPALPLH